MDNKKALKQCLLGFFVGIIAVTSVSAAVLLQADEVSYTNSLSKENVQNTKAALDELYKISQTNCPEGYICKKVPKSFADDDWEIVVEAIKGGNPPYQVGDTKTVDMGSFGTYTIRIANTSTPAECGGTDFSETACGFVLEFADVISEHEMNPAGEYQGTQYKYGWNKDGYPASSMHTYLENDIYNALPSTLRNAIIPTKVVSSHGSADTANFTSNDKLYLLSAHEVLEDGTSKKVSTYDTSWSNTRQLDYYKNLGVTTSNYSGAIKKDNYGINSWWWLRSAYSDHDFDFMQVREFGDWNSLTARSNYGVSPAFRIG